jgi:hypothetical protein
MGRHPMTSRYTAWRNLFRVVAPSRAVFLALAAPPAMGVILWGAGPKLGSPNAQVVAETDIDNVEEVALEPSVTIGQPAVLTRAELPSAISGDRAGPAGQLAHVTTRSLENGRVNFSIDTPWRNNMYAWVPVTSSGPNFAWLAHSCSP